MSHNGNYANFMQIALAEAQMAADRGEVPVGAVIVLNREIIAQTGNRMRELSDPTAHAEILAIRQACHNLGTERLLDADLYVSLEPCAMCAGAISFARIRRLYFGASDEKGGGVIHGGRLFSQKTCHHAPEVYDGINAETARNLLKQFFASKRNTCDPI